MSEFYLEAPSPDFLATARKSTSPRKRGEVIKP